MTTNFGQWRADEASRAASLWQKHFADHYDDETAPVEVKHRVFSVIARALGRDHENVCNRYAHYGPSFASSRHIGEVAHANAVKEMERRKLAAGQQSLTGAVFGDPPPGYSALDRKREGAPR